MARDDDKAPPELLKALSAPQISLVGEIDESSVEKFLDQLASAEKAGGDIALELTTLGGDAEMARRLVLEISAARSRLPGRFVFLGKTVIYSAGITIMSAFPRRDRWITDDTMLMIHCRKLEKTLELSGPIRTSIPKIEAMLHQLKVGLNQEDKNFPRLIEGSNIGIEEVWDRALHNWYLDADEALKRGLVAGIWQAQDPARIARRVDGSDDSNSFEARIADEGTIPETAVPFPRGH
jgi:ATP-dependent protease ClpP protease subunit